MNLRLDRKASVRVEYLGGVPALPEPWVHCYARMIQHTLEASDLVLDLDRPTVSYHSYARNVAAKRIGNCDWLLQLDTDHTFDPDLLLRLLNSAHQSGAKVLSGFYQSKTPPHHPIAYFFDADKPGVGVPLGEWSHPVFRVDATGGGCLLVHRSVFERIRAELAEDPFDPVIPPGATKPMGEDLSFGWRCKQLGIPVYLDTRVKYNHLRWKSVDLDDFEAYKHATLLGAERKVEAA
jgi:GT2 family glycosyltransferase